MVASEVALRMETGGEELASARAETERPLFPFGVRSSIHGRNASNASPSSRACDSAGYRRAYDEVDVNYK